MVTLTDLKEALREILGFGAAEIGREGVADALAQTLDIHSAYLGSIFYQNDGVNAHFRCAKRSLVITEAAKASDFWTEDGIDSAGNLEVLIQSRRSFQYPFVNYYTMLPADPPGGVDFGLENTAALGTGTMQFRRLVSGAFQAYIASLYRWTTINLDWALPADATTIAYHYSIKVNSNTIEFYINKILRAVALNSPHLTRWTMDGPPYTLFTLDNPVTPIINAQIEVYTGVLFPLDPKQVYISDGQPFPPRVFRLYDTGTEDLFAGKTVTAADVTLISHPFPVFGYSGKTIHFRADQASAANGLVVEYLTQAGNWRTYLEETYAANDDWFRTLTGEGVLARLSYTPAAYPAVVAEGEVTLR